MKKLAIVSYSNESGCIQYKILQELLQNRVIIEKYTVEDGSVGKGIEADLVVITTVNIRKIVQNYFIGKGSIVVSNLTILRSGFLPILSLPFNTKALLVHTDIREAMLCIDQIYQMGAKQIELIPYAPFSGNVGDVEVAITPGEEKNVPSSIKRIISIGNRVLDISTIVYILIYFKLEELFNTPAIRAYCDEIMLHNFTPSIDFAHFSFDLNEFMMTYHKTGIVGFSSDGAILHCNYMAEKLFEFKGRSVIGENILSLFPQKSIREAIKEMKPLVQKQIRLNNIDLIVKIAIGTASLADICYLTVEKAYESAVKIPSFKNQIIGRGFIAKYNFQDIITNNQKMKKLKDIAAMNAISDSSILVTGESGTGKELIVQSIHNASRRKDNPFVAINCAAVPESLLESELFGYDEGAFTGARRGGKMGLFELAHCGTLFLDEIGEMPVHLQARLLRVLQEKEVTRVGGQKVISIDVRVIAATNCNVAELIDTGQFRRDLYYRLNVIPLKVPPLRDRREDIPLLCETFILQLKANFMISGEAMMHLQQYYWEGNIRELHNYIEYFRNLNKETMEVEDVTSFFERDVEGLKEKQISEEEKEIFQLLRQYQTDKIVKFLFILEMLQHISISHKQAGRRSLAELSPSHGEKISEMEMRELLSELDNHQMVKKYKGRKGTTITDLGLKCIDVIKTIVANNYKF